MRTTIDLPDDLHRIARSIAHDRHVSVSQAVAELMRRGLAGQDAPEGRIVWRDGFPVLVGTGRPITTADVRSLEDE